MAAPRKRKSAKPAPKRDAAAAPTLHPHGIEDILAMLGTALGDGPGDSALEQAQDLMWDAWDTRDRKRRVAMAQEALRLSPDCADAFCLLAGETARTPVETIALYRQGVEAGERALGPAAFEEDVGDFWGILETRPYMRARQGLAHSLWDAGQHDEAIGHYRELLRLNPGDNQGNRYLLAECLLKLDRDQELAALIEERGDDYSVDFLYAKALLAFRRGGDSAAARAELAEAKTCNPHVAAYLLGRKRVPRASPDYLSFGGEDEAQEYARRWRPCWLRSEGALRWLGANA
jgi:tetratricopeptide (TPR) repeat protein